MEPKIKLNSDIDVLRHSPMIRGMVLTLRYAMENDGIGLTKSDAMNRKFVTWAAEHFNWPGYTSEELFSINKVLNEHDMMPLWPLRETLRYLKLIRRYKGTLRATRTGQELAKAPNELFDLVAPLYLYHYDHDDLFEEEDYSIPGNWHIFLNLINIKARQGCSQGDLTDILYPRPDTEIHDPYYSLAGSAFLLNVLRPLCWLGLLREERGGDGWFGKRTYHKTPLWSACLKLESDNQVKLRLV